MARPTVVMLAIFLVLAGGVFALEKTQPQKTDTTVYVLEVKDGDVQRLDVTTTAGSTAFERAEPFGWKFADSDENADLSRVSSVVNRLAKLRSSAKVTDKVSDLATYGLNPPADTATLTMKDGTDRRVLIGAKTPNDAAYFAIVDGRPDLHTINTLLVGDIEKLVSEPPVPVTPTPATTTPTATTAAGAVPTPEADSTPSPTIGLPIPTTQ